MNRTNVYSVELRLPLHLGFEKIAISVASSVASLLGFEPERVEDLKTAIAEAYSNAIEHGNKLSQPHFGIIFSLDGSSLEGKDIELNISDWS